MGKAKKEHDEAKAERKRKQSERLEEERRQREEEERLQREAEAEQARIAADAEAQRIAALQSADPNAWMDEKKAALKARFEEFLSRRDYSNLRIEWIEEALKFQAEALTLYRTECLLTNETPKDPLTSSACLAKHLAIDAGGVANTRHAAEVLLAHLQRPCDLACAMGETEEDRCHPNAFTKPHPYGRVRGDSGADVHYEAPPVDYGEDGGREHGFEELAEHIKALCEGGQGFKDIMMAPVDPQSRSGGLGDRGMLAKKDVLFPPSIIHLPMRMGKTMLMLSYVFLCNCLDFPVSIGVAPNKLPPILELMRRVSELCGLQELGVLRVGTTLNTAHFAAENNASGLTNFKDHHIAAGTNVLVHAHGYAPDQKLKMALVDEWVRLGKVVIHVWDEPEQFFTTPNKAGSGKSVLQMQRDKYFHAGPHYHMLCGATILMAFREPALLGTMLTNKPQSEFPTFLKSIKRRGNGTEQYNGMDCVREAVFDTSKEVTAFGVEGVRASFMELRGAAAEKLLTTVEAQLERMLREGPPTRLRIGEGEKERKVPPKRVLTEPIGEPWELKLTVPEKQERHELRIRATRKAIGEIKQLRTTPKKPPDEIDSYLPEPTEKDGGLVVPFIKMEATAKVHAYIRSYLCRADTLMRVDTDDGTYGVKKTLMLAIVQTGKPTVTDPAGGMTAWSFLTCELAIKHQKPTIVLTYTTVDSVKMLKGLAEDYLGDAAAKKVKYGEVYVPNATTGGNTKKTVTAYAVFPKIGADGAVTYSLEAIEFFLDAQSALAWAHDQLQPRGVALVRALKPVYIGMNMWAGSITLAVSNNLTLTLADGTEAEAWYVTGYIAQAIAKTTVITVDLQTGGRALSSVPFAMPDFTIEKLGHKGAFAESKLWVKAEGHLSKMLSCDLQPKDKDGEPADYLYVPQAMQTIGDWIRCPVETSGEVDDDMLEELETRILVAFHKRKGAKDGTSIYNVVERTYRDATEPFEIESDDDNDDVQELLNPKPTPVYKFGVAAPPLKKHKVPTETSKGHLQVTDAPWPMPDVLLVERGCYKPLETDAAKLAKANPGAKFEWQKLKIKDRSTRQNEANLESREKFLWEATERERVAIGFVKELDPLCNEIDRADHAFRIRGPGRRTPPKYSENRKEPLPYSLDLRVQEFKDWIVEEKRQELDDNGHSKEDQLRLSENAGDADVKRFKHALKWICATDQFKPVKGDGDPSREIADWYEGLGTTHALRRTALGWILRGLTVTAQSCGANNMQNHIDAFEKWAIMLMDGNHYMQADPARREARATGAGSSRAHAAMGGSGSVAGSNPLSPSASLSGASPPRPRTYVRYPHLDPTSLPPYQSVVAAAAAASGPPPSGLQPVRNSRADLLG